MSADDKSNTANDPILDSDDTSDAFARAKPINEPSGDGKGRSKRSKKNAGDRAREPAIDPTKKIEIDEDDLPPMTAMDAAEVIVSMMDQMFEMAVMFRGYDNVVIKLPDGRTQSLMEKMREHDKIKKDMLKRDLARVLKSSGATISPNTALVLSGMICYAAPVMAMEFAIYTGKKNAAKGGAS